jgi:hypothetical protein
VTLDELSVQMFEDLTSLRLMQSASMNVMALQMMNVMALQMMNVMALQMMNVMALQIFDDECVTSRIADPFNHKVRVRRATMRAARV